MADGHFVSAYLNVEDPAVNPIELMDGISVLFGEASWVAGSAKWINDGIVVELVMPTGRDHGFDVPALVDHRSAGTARHPRIRRRVVRSRSR